MRSFSLPGGKKAPFYPEGFLEYLGIEGSDEGRSWCAGKLWVCGVRLGRLERDTSACTHQAQRLKKIAIFGDFLYPWNQFVPGGCNTFSERADPKNVLRC